MLVHISSFYAPYRHKYVKLSESFLPEVNRALGDIWEIGFWFQGDCLVIAKEHHKCIPSWQSLADAVSSQLGFPITLRYVVKRRSK